MLVLYAGVSFVLILCVQFLMEVYFWNVDVLRGWVVCGKIGDCKSSCIFVVVTKKIDSGVVCIVFEVCFVCGGI